MSKLKVLTILLLVILSLFFYKISYALHDPQNTANCSFISTNPAPVIPSDRITLPGPVKYTLHVNTAGTYDIYLQRATGWTLWIGEVASKKNTANAEGFIEFTINPAAGMAIFKEGQKNIEVVRQGSSSGPCIVKYKISKQEEAKEVKCTISQTPGKPNGESSIRYYGEIEPEGLYRFRAPDINKNYPEAGFTVTASKVIDQNLGIFDPGRYRMILQKQVTEFSSSLDGSYITLDVWKNIPSSSCSLKDLVISTTLENPHPDPAAIVVGTGASSVTAPKIPTYAQGQQCGTAAHPAIKTAIGCIPTNPAEFINALIKFVLGISGGLAFLMMVLGAFQMLASAGNPETLQAGRERFKSAIIGLLFVVFAILILQIIGVNILNIPGFS